MNRLIINTANENLHIVLTFGDKLFTRDLSSKVRHNEALIPCVEGLLTEAKIQLKDIERFGIIVGPGSFTGIRVGIATIKAFRDALNVPAVGINNLDLLFATAILEYEDTKVVAIKGSNDSYFVARLVNGIVYKYDHNLTRDELLNISKDSKVAMYTDDSEIQPNIVELNDNVLVDLCDKSTDTSLIPVYYQLSQAEREKQRAMSCDIVEYSPEYIDDITNLEAQSIEYNTLTKNQIEQMIDDGNHIALIAKCDNKPVAFVIGECSDEVSIVSLAVDKEYRNIGIATRLINSLIDYSKANGYHCISLEVKVDNIGAYLLYEKLGFTTRRIRPKYYEDGKDCLEMSLRLD